VRIILLGLLLASNLLLATYSYAMTDGLYSISPTPDWVKPISINENERSNTLSGQSIDYLLVNYQTKATQDNRYHRYRGFVQKALTLDGIKDSGTIEVYFKPDFQKVSLHHVTLIRDGKRLDKIDDARISVVNIEPESDVNLYSGQAKVIIIIPDFKLGDVLDYAYTLSGRNPVVGDKLYSSFSLGWGIPINRLFVSLEVPKNKQLTFKTEVVSYQPEYTSSNSQQRWELDISDVPAYQGEDQSPGYENAFPYIMFSEFKSWFEVRDWAGPLFEYESPVEHPIWTEWLASIKSQPDNNRKTTHALQLVQNNIRYIGIEVGENSHRPRAPSVTLNNAYGDCKDVALLLVSLLQAANVYAEPVLVNTHSGRAVKQWLPSAFAFNHVIVRAWVNEQFIYIDPTLNYQAGEDISALGYYDYEIGLPVFSHSELIRLPERLLDQPRIVTSETFTAYDFALPVRLDVKITYLNEEADYQRFRLNNYLHSDIEKSFVDYYYQRYGVSKMNGALQFEDNSAQNEVTMTLSLWVSDFYSYDTDDEVYRYDVRAFSIDDELSEPASIERSLGFDLGDLTEVKHTVQIQHPVLYSSEDLPILQEVFQDTHFDFSVNSQEIANESRFQFHYKQKKRAVDSEDITNYAELVRNAREHLSYNGWLTSDLPPEVTSPGRILLQDLLVHAGADQL
jgi:transglutaminase-like putative cysteine protease